MVERKRTVNNNSRVIINFGRLCVVAVVVAAFVYVHSSVLFVIFMCKCVCVQFSEKGRISKLNRFFCRFVTIRP